MERAGLPSRRAGQRTVHISNTIQKTYNTYAYGQKLRKVPRYDYKKKTELHIVQQTERVIRIAKGPDKKLMN